MMGAYLQMENLEMGKNRKAWSGLLEKFVLYQ